VDRPVEQTPPLCDYKGKEHVGFTLVCEHTHTHMLDDAKNQRIVTLTIN
jgi:hypothetical protein